MPLGYYSDLSNASSSDESSSSSDEEDYCQMMVHDRDGASAPRKKSPNDRAVTTPPPRPTRSPNSRQQLLWKEDCSTKSPSFRKTQQKPESRLDSRVVVHLDVDCFYVQCEMLDRGLPEDRPIAIGQKHIIVTCNYAARTAGVKKLELREQAQAKCPSLLILEGSDLERYRVHGRKIYEAFRGSCRQLSSNVTVCKGSMDEMTADITSALTNEEQQQQQRQPVDSYSIFVYGESSCAEQVNLVEDQSGDSIRVSASSSSTDNSSATKMPATYQSRIRCILQEAARLTLQIRQRILQETGFRCTLGLSTNPLLAKLATGLKKPGVVNVLVPWRARFLVEQMPLRKIPGVGHRTMKLLRPALEQTFSHRSGSDTVWTCGDLARVPSLQLSHCLRTLPGSAEARENMVQKLRCLCRGEDFSTVVDDDGGLPKVVSCENSFRRGTVVTHQAVHSAIATLCERLPRLFHERRQWSDKPDLAVPTTIRLAVRVVEDESHPSVAGRSRPFVTRSKQCCFDGKQFVRLSQASELQAEYIRHNTLPLMKSIILNKSKEINVTRISLALTGFLDTKSN